MNDTIALLERRRSAPPACMTGPGPTRRRSRPCCTVASRVPDHGKLAPWRFIVFEGAGARAGRPHRARDQARGQAGPRRGGAARRNCGRFSRAPLVVAVVSRAAPARQDPRMGAGAVGRRGLHGPDRRGRARSASPRPGSPNGAPMTRASARRSGLRSTSASPASSISAGASADRGPAAPAARRHRHDISRGIAPMFYETARRDKALLPHDPFKAIVAPRPIGWISTRARDGRVNLAPYSFFNAFGGVARRSSASPARAAKDSAAFARRAASSSPIWRRSTLRDADERDLGAAAARDSEFATPA